MDPKVDEIALRIARVILKARKKYAVTPELRELWDSGRWASDYPDREPKPFDPLDGD